MFAVKDLACVHDLFASPSVLSLASTDTPKQDLWNQTKLVRERSELAKKGIIRICQPNHIFSELKHFTLNLNLDPTDIELFFLDAYCAPILVTKLKTEGKIQLVKGTTEFKGTSSVESVIYNSALNQWERLLEPASEKVVPVKISFLIGKVDMTQVVDNMEEIPIAARGIDY